MKPLHKMTCREYTEHHNERYPKWNERESFYLYLHCGSRLKITPEQSDELWFGLDRDEEAGLHEAYDADADERELASDFANMFCQHLSIHQLNFLIPEITKMRDDWEADRALRRKRP